MDGDDCDDGDGVNDYEDDDDDIAFCPTPTTLDIENALLCLSLLKVFIVAPLKRDVCYS